MSSILALKIGTVLVGDFKIQRVLGAGGFGITYLAEELALTRQVTIKEYFPSDFAVRDGSVDATPRSLNCAGDYRWGLDRFIEEAQILAKFEHPNIVRVYRYFRANNTGYIVLRFEEGLSLKGWLKGLGRAPRQAELDALIAPLLDALETIHKADFLHRDIAPDNIIVRKDGSPVLIDFGSARGEIAKHSKTLSALVKPGYSPYEQYATTSRQQGPWSDIYSLGATLYQAITGKRPADAPSRMVSDELVPSRDGALSSYRPSFLAAIDQALLLAVEARPQSIAAWRKLLLPEAAPAQQPATPQSAEPAAASPGAPTRRLETEAAPPMPAIRRKPAAPSAEPRPRGRLMEFLAGGRREPTAASPEARPSPPPAAPAKPAPAKVAKAPAASPKPAPQRASGDDGHRSGGLFSRPQTRRTMRSLAVKLLIGLGVASIAVGLQDYWPRGGGSAPAINTSQARSAAALMQIKAHRGPVTAIAFADDGRTLVSAGSDGAVRLWSTAGGSAIRTLDGAGGAVNGLSVNGRRIAAGFRDGTIVLWDAEKGSRIGQFKRNGAEIWSVALTDDAERVAAAGHDWVVALWDPKSGGAPASLLEGHESAVQALAIAPGRSLLASGSADKTVKLWNVDGGSLVRTYRGHDDFVTAVAISRDGRTLASASLDGTIRVWSGQSSRRIHTLKGHRGRVSSLAFSPGGQSLASAGQDGTIRLWDVRRGRMARLLSTAVADYRALAFAPEGNRLAAGAEDGVLRIWDPGNLPVPHD